MEFLTRILNKFFTIRGINLGSGKHWSKIRWAAIDQINGQVLDKTSRLPFSDNSLEYVFTEHFLEHIDDDDVNNILSEAARVLRANGVIRIITPDFEKIYKKYQEQDVEFFLNEVGFKGRPEWKAFGVKYCIENYLGHWFANYDSTDNKSDNDFYRGPPIGIEDEIKQKANHLSLKDFSEWIVSKIPRDRFKKPHGHINWFDYHKLYVLLKSNGFKDIKRSSCGNSEYSEFLTNDFDKKGRAHISLYVEARKI